LLLSSVSGCDSPANNVSTVSLSGSGDQTAPQDKTYEISWIGAQNSSLCDDPVMLRYWEQLFNVKIDYWNIDANNSNDILSTKFASGLYPNVLYVNSLSNFSTYTRQQLLGCFRRVYQRPDRLHRYGRILPLDSRNGRLQRNNKKLQKTTVRRQCSGHDKKGCVRCVQNPAGTAGNRAGRQKRGGQLCAAAFPFGRVFGSDGAGTGQNGQSDDYVSVENKYGYDWAIANGYDQNIIRDEKYESLPYSGKYESSLARLEDEVFIAIITGQQPIDYFDTFTAQWKTNGGNLIKLSNRKSTHRSFEAVNCGSFPMKQK